MSHICNVGNAGGVTDVCTARDVGCAGSVIGVSIEHHADNVGNVVGVHNVGGTCRVENMHNGVGMCIECGVTWACLACFLKTNHDLWLLRVAIS